MSVISVVYVAKSKEDAEQFAKWHVDSKVEFRNDRYEVTYYIPTDMYTDGFVGSSSE